MDYLKREIFYPIKDNTDKNEINKARSDYNAYIASIKEKLPKNLIKAYTEEDNFHDYIIRELVILGDARCYSQKSDRVIIKLCFENSEIDMEFYEISFLKLEMQSNKSCWTIIGDAQQPAEEFVGFEEIVLCELGLVKDNLYKFEFVTSSGANVEIHFAKIRITKKTRRF